MAETFLKGQQAFTEDGWQRANETWTYASATTITVPSGAGSKYAKGDKIKLTQTTVKYFYVFGVADTVLTVTGGSDYTVANAAISANYYSHQHNPIGFPDSFGIAVTNFTTSGTAFTNQPTLDLLKMQIIEKRCYLRGLFHTHATSGGTAIFYVNVTAGQLPSIAQDDSTGTCLNISTRATTGFSYVNAGTQNRIELYKYDATAIAGNGAYVGFDINYII